MNETTTMLANTVKLILGDLPWVYSPQLSMINKIEELRKKNLDKEFTGYDEDGNEQFKLGEPKNKELDEALQILSIVAEKDKSELKRYTESKVDVLESKIKTVRKIVNKYSDIEEEY